MDENIMVLKSPKNENACIRIISGHFVTKHSHVNTYIDHSLIKTQHVNARETAITLAEEFMTNTMVEAIVCLKNTEMIGGFMADALADPSSISLSAGNNIGVITPEFDSQGHIFFRENKLPFLVGKQVLIFIDSMSSGIMTHQTIESVRYYGGILCGAAAVFSAISKVAGFEVKSVFTSGDLPNYQTYKMHECPLCQAGQKIDGIVNSFGYAKF